MEVEDLREVIASALEKLKGDDGRVKQLGNRVYLVTGDDEFELVIRTMNPKGSKRLAARKDLR